MLRCRSLLLLLGLAMLAGIAGCAKNTSQPDSSTREDPIPEVAEVRPKPTDANEDADQTSEVADTPTVFDAANAIFDTLEPPPRPGIEINEPTTPRPRPPPRQAPSPPPPPEPEPLPPPTPAPPVAGSCDVRQTESYCFTYTGAAWSASAAEDHCAAAPEATYRASECPDEGRIGTCVFRRGETPSRELIYVYYEPYDLGLARIACPGRFTEER